MGLVSPTVSFINGKEGKIVEREQWSIGRARYFCSIYFFRILAYILLYFFFILKTDYPALQFSLV